MGYAEIRFLIPGYGKNRPTPRQRKIVRERIRERDGDNCWICGYLMDFDLPRDHPEAPTLEHIIPFAQGGSNHITNLGLSHQICNEKRRNPDIK